MKAALKFLRHYIGPFLLIIGCFIPLVMLVWYTNVALDGSIEKLCNIFAQRGTFATTYKIWHPYIFGTTEAWKILALFVCTTLFLIKILPGRPFLKGGTGLDGTLLISKANGFYVYLSALALYLFASYFLKLFSPTIIYDHLAGLLGALNIFGLIFWVFLFLKEKYNNVQEPSFKMNRSIQFFDWNLNMYTICRCAMIGWGLAIVSFASKQHALYGLSDSMLVSVALQLIYIAKFFWSEIGYLRAVDISYDRSGVCICWGCIVWIPAIYTSPALYLVNHPYHLGAGVASVLFLCGASCILLNFLIDRQRLHVRNRNGECLVWRKKPEVIFANYTTEWGEEKQNLLLVSGWWGISRHFHYVPEFLGAFFWSITALFHHFLPFFYLCFLTILLLERAYRHERRCAIKYGKDWEKYCEKVPFRLIPFLY